MTAIILNEDAEYVLKTNKCDVIVTDTPFGYTNDRGRPFKREGTTDLNYHSFAKWDEIDYVNFHNYYVPMMLNSARKAVYIHCPVERLGHFKEAWPDYYKGHIIQCITNPVPSFFKSTYRAATVAVAYFQVSGRINWLGHREMYTWSQHTVCGPAEKLYWHTIKGEVVIPCIGKKTCPYCLENNDHEIKPFPRHSHPTQKTLSQVRTQILASSDEGDVILDPFMGVGTTIVEAIANGRKAIGNDNNKTYVDVTEMRLQGEFRRG
jgi:hypothetical protein